MGSISNLVCVPNVSPSIADGNCVVFTVMTSRYGLAPLPVIGSFRLLMAERLSCSYIESKRVESASTSWPMDDIPDTDG